MSDQYYGVWNRNYSPTFDQIKSGENCVPGTHRTHLSVNSDVEVTGTIGGLPPGDYDFCGCAEYDVEQVTATTQEFTITPPDIEPDWGTGIPDRDDLPNGEDLEYHIWHYLNNDVYPPPTYALDSAPPGFFLDDPNIGTIRCEDGTIAGGQITVTATNAAGSSQDTFSWEPVEAAPTWDEPLPAQSNAQSAGGSYDLSLSISDPGYPEAITYSAPGAPAGFTVAGSVLTCAPGTAVQSSTPIPVRADNGLQADTTISWTVTENPPAPEGGAGGMGINLNLKI